MSKKRIITSIVILLCTVGLFFSRLWTPLVFDLAFGALAVVACIEVSKVAYAAGKPNNAYFVCTYPATLYLVTMFYLNKKFTFSYYIFILLMLLLAYFLIIFIVTGSMHKTSVDEMGKIGYKGSKWHFALDKSMFSISLMVYPALLFLSIVILNHFTEFTSVSALNLSGNILSMFLLVTVFAVTMICDSMAMITGITFKGKKLCPKISPNKTISGAIGGLIGGIASAFVVYALFNLSPSFVSDFSAIGGNAWHILIVGVVGAIISQIGDILASLLKRHADVKDYGNIFPGHGGVMDRMDGLIFNSAFVTLFFVLIVII